MYRYTQQQWGKEQADSYIQGLFEHFGKISQHKVLSKPIPASFGVLGYCCLYKKHYIYWKKLNDNTIGIVTVLHEKMHQISRLQEDFDFLS